MTTGAFAELEEAESEIPFLMPGGIRPLGPAEGYCDNTDGTRSDGDLSFKFHSDYASGNIQGLHICDLEHSNAGGTGVIQEAAQGNIKYKIRMTVYPYTTITRTVSISAMTYDGQTGTGDNVENSWHYDDNTNTLYYKAKITVDDPGETELVWIKNYFSFQRSYSYWTCDWFQSWWWLDFKVVTETNYVWKGSTLSKLHNEAWGKVSDWHQMKFASTSTGFTKMHEDYINKWGSPKVKWGAFLDPLERYDRHDPNDNNEVIDPADVLGSQFTKKESGLTANSWYGAEVRNAIFY